MSIHLSKNLFKNLTKCLQGIPENIQQEQAQARGAPTTARTAEASSAASPPVVTQSSSAPATTGDEGDQPINLFEAAAQAGRTGGAGGARGSRGTETGSTNLAGLGAGIGAAAGAGGGTEGAGGLGNLDFLRSNPQFQQLRQIVQTQPRMLEPILQQVAAGNPQLAQLIGSNPEQFLQLLSEDTEGDVPLPPGAQEISVTEEEREAIERVSPRTALHLVNFSSDSVSSVVWVLRETWLFRLISLVTRTKNLLQISCLTNRTTGMMLPSQVIR